MWRTTTTTALNLAVYSTWARGSDASGPGAKYGGSPEGHWRTNIFQSWPNKGQKNFSWIEKSVDVYRSSYFLLFFSFFTLFLPLFLRFLLSSCLGVEVGQSQGCQVCERKSAKQTLKTSPTGNKNQPSTRAQNMLTPNQKHSNSIAVIVKCSMISEKWHRKCSASAWKAFFHTLFHSDPITVILYRILSNKIQPHYALAVVLV